MRAVVPEIKEESILAGGGGESHGPWKFSEVA